MVTHDIKEGFELGSRLWVFDKLRDDPQAPQAYGAQVTFDLPLKTSSGRQQAQQLFNQGASSLHQSDDSKKDTP